jgi:CelD/BcsL family acetyltransferase involved in cellulose biosynthesis
MSRIAVASDRADAASVRSGTASVRVVVRPAAEAIGPLAAEWEALALQASEPNAFSEHWFVAASLATLGKGSAIRLIEVRRGARLIGLLPVSVERGYARLPVAHVENWLHRQSFLGTPLVAAGEEEAFWSAAIAALDGADWAPGLLHLRGLTLGGPVQRALSGAIVHREVRAFLESDLGPASYYEQAVRQKKRKEIRRLRNRLAELGKIDTHILDDAAALDAWCDTYLALEKAGWKGKAGSALACEAETEAFFRAAVRGAWDAGRLQFRRLEVGGRTIAMLVNFLCAPGSFSFKTVFDEDYARFSPGVLIQLDNLDILAAPGIRWMDSCAAEDHPMIDSLWTERRTIVRVTVRLKGARRGAIFALCRALEIGSARVRGLIR